MTMRIIYKPFNDNELVVCDLSTGAKFSSARARQGRNILEVSSASECKLGRHLSAMHLSIEGMCLESIYQGSKVFFGKNNEEWMELNGYKAKLACRNRGKPEGFRWGSLECSHRGSLWYDYLYIRSLRGYEEYLKILERYEGFLDIFSSTTKIACQAKTCKLIVEWNKAGKLVGCTDSFEKFESIWLEYARGGVK